MEWRLYLIGGDYHGNTMLVLFTGSRSACSTWDVLSIRLLLFSAQVETQ